MKKVLLIGGLVLSGVFGNSLSAQDAVTQADESATRRIQDLEVDNVALRKKLQVLEEEMFKVRDEISRLKNAQNNGQSADVENYKQLAEKIKEIDRKRIAENQEVNEKMIVGFEKLQHLVAERPPAPRDRVGPPVPPPDEPRVVANANPTPPPTGPQKGYEYAIKNGDTLSGIVVALKANGIKLSQKQIIDGNPDVKWNRLRIGQKIFIPQPAAP